MNWYIAKIVYQIMIDHGEYEPQFEEQLRLIRANSYQEALGKANLLGDQEEALFYNYKDEPVYWKFIDVAELRPVHELRDGMQLSSHIEHPKYAEEYLSIMYSRAESIRTDTSLV